MKFYLAPLEGVTGYIYRNALEKYFPGTDRYFTPFIVPDQKRTLRSKELRDVLPENNRVGTLVPQILTNDGDRFREAVQALGEYGYEEVNLNLGCPSGTVVSRRRGAGLLGVPDELDRFLDRIFSENEVRISIKTRIGMTSPDEAYRLIHIYNQYPLSELIIHPRTREEYYRGQPHREVFAKLLPLCRMPVCYNGNLLTARDYAAFREQFPTVDRVMLGRGVIANPGLIRELCDGEHAQAAKPRSESVEAVSRMQPDLENREHAHVAQQQGERADTARRVQARLNDMEHAQAVRKTGKAELRAFHDELFEQYREIFKEEKNAIFHMKELWTYLLHSFADAQKHGKRLRKAGSLNEYLCAVDGLFRECELLPDGPEVWTLPMK